MESRPRDNKSLGQLNGSSSTPDKKWDPSQYNQNLQAQFSSLQSAAPTPSSPDQNVKSEETFTFGEGPGHFGFGC